MSQEYEKKTPYPSHSQKDLLNKKELALEDKKKRRELYNREIFGVNSSISNGNGVPLKEYNPFYDNSYLHNNFNANSKHNNNISTLSNGQLAISPPSKETEQKQRELKDQMIQTDDGFFANPEKNPLKNQEDQANNKKKKANFPSETNIFKPFFQESHDHGILQKIKQDYKDYVRKEGGNPPLKSEPIRQNLHKSGIDQRKYEEQEEIFEDLSRKYKKNQLSYDSKRTEILTKNEGKKAYAQELLDMIQAKNQKKLIEKEKNDIISMKLLKESFENSPFGKAGSGAPNRDAYGNLLIRKGIYVNDNYGLYKKLIDKPKVSLQKNDEDIPEDYNANSFEFHEENPVKNNNSLLNRSLEYYPENPQKDQINVSNINIPQQNSQHFNAQPMFLGYNPQTQLIYPVNPMLYQQNPIYYQQNPQNYQQNPNYNSWNPNNNYNNFNNGNANANNFNDTNNNNMQNYNESPNLPEKNVFTSQEPRVLLKENPVIAKNTPKVPKVLDMKQIEKEFLLQTEYKRTFDPNAKKNVDLDALREQEFFSFNEYDREIQMKKYQEQARINKILYDQIEEKRKKKEQEKQMELLKQQQAEERFKRQREEIMEKYRRDMEKKNQELQAIKDSVQNKSLTIKSTKPIELPQLPAENISKPIESNENSQYFLDELKRKEDEKLKEIQKQKALYEQKLEDVNSHLSILKNQLFSQQNMLNEELNKLKAEALVANEQRFRAQKELENLREDLKRQELLEEIRRNELSQALIKTRPVRDYSDQSNVLYPQFARDFHKAYRFHQLNNEYINDSLDNLVQRTSFIPLNDYSKPFTRDKAKDLLRNDHDEFDYTNGLTQATKVQGLPRSLVNGYKNDNDINALDVLRTNEERLDELQKLDKSNKEGMQSKLENLINQMNSN